jgi:hypothetical protein
LLARVWRLRVRPPCGMACRSTNGALRWLHDVLGDELDK